MTIQELIERLSEYDPKSKVSLLHQPNYPLESTLRGPVSENEIRASEGEAPVDPTINVVYLLEGTQLGYGRRGAWEAVQ